MKNSDKDSHLLFLKRHIGDTSNVREDIVIRGQEFNTLALIQNGRWKMNTPPNS